MELDLETTGRSGLLAEQYKNESMPLEHLGSRLWSLVKGITMAATIRRLK